MINFTFNSNPSQLSNCFMINKIATANSLYFTFSDLVLKTRKDTDFRNTALISLDKNVPWSHNLSPHLHWMVVEQSKVNKMFLGLTITQCKTISENMGNHLNSHFRGKLLLQPFCNLPTTFCKVMHLHVTQVFLLSLFSKWFNIAGHG